MKTVSTASTRSAKCMVPLSRIRQQIENLETGISSDRKNIIEIESQLSKVEDSNERRILLRLIANSNLDINDSAEIIKEIQTFLSTHQDKDWIEVDFKFASSHGWTDILDNT